MFISNYQKKFTNNGCLFDVCLCLGNVEFAMSSSGSLKVYGEKELISSAVLLGLSSRQLREILVGSSRGSSKVSRTANASATSSQINSILRGLSRALYTRLLGAVLRRINEQLLRLNPDYCETLLNANFTYKSYCNFKFLFCNSQNLLLFL